MTIMKDMVDLKIVKWFAEEILMKTVVDIGPLLCIELQASN